MEPIRHVQASDALEGEQILEIVRGNGWTTSAMRSYITDVGFVLERVRRQLGRAAPPRLPYPTDDPTGVHLFGHSQP